MDLNIPLDSDSENVDRCYCFPLVLDTCFDILCDPRTFQTHQLNRVALHDSKRSTYEHTKKCAETLVLLRQSDRAVQLFLETEANNTNYYTDSLRACLVAAIRSSGASQSTIKLVATNLIANGKLDEGVQLLCMIDKGLDACRYLQTYGKWDQAAWLAKATLDYNDCAEVMRRWIEHLSGTQISQQSRGLLLSISLGQFKKALLMVFGMRFFDRAALFAEACLEYGLLPIDDGSVSLLLESVFTEYARYLYAIGLINAAKYYCTKGGQEGKRLLEDIS